MVIMCHNTYRFAVHTGLGFRIYGSISTLHIGWWHVYRFKRYISHRNPYSYQVLEHAKRVVYICWEY